MDEVEGDKDLKEQTLLEVASKMREPPALDMICSIFGLSSFERDILLLCAGMELDSGFTTLCAAAQGDPGKPYPTFSLALAILCDPHWSGINPEAPLRRWRLIDIGSGATLVHSPLRIDERILHYLIGIDYLDERLTSLIKPVYSSGDLVPVHQRLADRLMHDLSQSMSGSLQGIVNLCGEDVFTRREIASMACARLGLRLSRISAEFIPTSIEEIEALARLWEREAVLKHSALLLECEEADFVDRMRSAIVNRLIDCVEGALIISSAERFSSDQISIIPLDVERMTMDEQRSLWENCLEKEGLESDEQFGSIVSQFSLSPGKIKSACIQAFGKRSVSSPPNDASQMVWEACRSSSRPRMNGLAQRIESAAYWNDLVLPENQRQILLDISTHVRQRFKVYQEWGFAAKSSRGLGISALFAGPSGTGKTMAAEVLANELRLDLYRIDLSQVVSKYIGETEKNLGRIFDAAETGGAILLFDEADAIFGKRSEVKDSHDRYANIEISYLLQRVESYRGLAILTTNMKSSLDPAFLRRIRFSVQFPFPDGATRAEIWRRAFPQETPTEGLDEGKLAKLNATGGTIRNIAIYSAFLAADEGKPVGMKHIMRAARVEYSKLERTLTEAEIGGWV
jgi:hypothetical protein